MDSEEEEHAALYQGIAAILIEVRDLRRQLAQRGLIEMRTMDEVLNEIRSQRTQIDGVKSLVNQLRQQVKDATGTLPPDVQSKIDAAFDEAHNNSAALTEAITTDPNGSGVPVGNEGGAATNTGSSDNSGSTSDNTGSQGSAGSTDTNTDNSSDTGASGPVDGAA